VNSNRIIGIVRTSPSRLNSSFDVLASKIEVAWYDAVKCTDKIGEKNIDTRADEKKLLMVTFIPMVAIREGVYLPPYSPDLNPIEVFFC